MGTAIPIDAEQASTRTDDQGEIAARTPDQAEARLTSLDLVRGFAVLGILLPNLVSFARPGPYYFTGILIDYNPLEEAGWIFQYMLIDGKLRGLFALLFGTGMAIFVGRALRDRNWSSAYGLQLRRLLWLALFGVVHFYLLFIGDILLDYALAGLIALPFIRIKPKILMPLGLFITAFISVGGSFALWPGETLEALSAPAGSEARAEYDAEMAKERERLLTASEQRAEAGFLGMVAWRHEIRPVWTRLLNPPATMGYVGMMFIGAALLRMGFFAGTWEKRRILAWGWSGIALGAVLTAPLAWMAVEYAHAPGVMFFVQFAPTPLLRLPMIIGMAALFVAWTPALMRSGFGQRLAAAGRMAFTNYIMSSVMMGIVFLSWGLGLYGMWNRVPLFLFAFGGIAIMLAWSRPWLARFRFGPLEWLWRCLTYMRIFPIRRETPLVASETNPATSRA
ncbi:DUF418 domain-containing protein [Croceicoccus mobilis]|uniref:Transporter n=1 Tax=Croceicoccus mobilis TaxID=1703339 RepID=A0A916YPU8_9SPHN|nr:DUF418 domain-containing protein [Croceicoccus mobilis]GGD55437.1 transporter [Croceicoccus mobilis]